MLLTTNEPTVEDFRGLKLADPPGDVAHPADTLETLREENRRLQRQLGFRLVRELVGHGPAVEQLRELVHEAAQDDLPTLLVGEPGTGAQSAAQSIHTLSRRSHRPFVMLDCRVLTAEGFEHELFGNASHTAAAAPGRLQTAEGGTLFLKDVDAAALTLQKSLVGVVRRCAGTPRGPRGGRPCDVRILASAHANLHYLADQDHFRADLLRELSARTIATPPLRDRLQDVGLLAEHFLGRLAVDEGRPAKRLTLDALQLLQEYHWPGNVRELRNVLERACAIHRGELLTAEMIRPWLADGKPALADDDVSASLSLREMERKLIETTFARCAGNRERTARVLQIGLRTLSGKLREYGYPPRGGPGSNLVVPQRKAA